MKNSVSWFLWAFLVVVVAGFIGLRLFKLESSLLFFNDIGRDFIELEEWRTTGLPPLLGPQTSALPFNQSAFYFYLLYPGYLLSGLSPFSSVYTLIFVYMGLLITSFVWFMRKGTSGESKTWAWAIVVMAALITMHPQAIIQNRFVWNPSFAFPAALVALLAWLWGTQKWSWKMVVIWSIASAASISFSYSVAPLFLVLFLLTPFLYGFKKLKTVWLVVGTACAGVVINAPTFVFELRHNFTLTQLLLHGQKLPQSGLDWGYKVNQLFHYLGGSDKVYISGAVCATFFIGALLGVYSWHSRKLEHARNRSLLTLGIFLATLIITIVVPIAVQTHYIFGLFVAALIVIGFLPRRIGASFVIVAAAAWLQPPTLATYYKPAFRTVSQMQSCFQQVCQAQEEEPLFVSVQAGFHPFHNGPEHRYLLSRAGCQVKAIEREPSAAKYMAVVIDDSIYEHNKTAYNELTLFGQSTVKTEFNCQENFKVLLLESVGK